MERYMENPAVLTVQNGVSYVSFTLKNSGVEVFRFKQGDSFVDAEVMEAGDAQVVTFEVADLQTALDVYMETQHADQDGEGKHEVQIVFQVVTLAEISDKDQAVVTAIRHVNTSVHPAANNDTAEVESAAIHQPVPVEIPQANGDAVVENSNTEAAATYEPASIQDGTYTIPFRVLKDETEETSMMDRYTEKPAKVTVSNGVYKVFLTLKNSDWTKVFRVEKAGSYVDAEVVSQDEAADTRTVAFEVTDLAAKVNAYTEVLVPELQYDGKYEVQIQFDPTGLTEVQ
jgi:heme-binding NEAT domain protein